MIPVYLTNVLRGISIDTSLFDQYVKRNRYKRLLFLRLAYAYVKSLIDTYLFDQYVRRCSDLNLFV